MPAGSRMDTPPAKSKPINDSVSASGIAGLRKEKQTNKQKTQTKPQKKNTKKPKKTNQTNKKTQAKPNNNNNNNNKHKKTQTIVQKQIEDRGERRVKICEKDSLADSKIHAAGVGGGVPGNRREIPLQSVVKTMLRQLCPCSPWRSTGEQLSTRSPWRTPCRSRWMPEGGYDLVGNPYWRTLTEGPVVPWREKPMLEQICWQDLWPHGGPRLEQSVPEGPHHVEMTHSEAVHREMQPVGKIHVGEVHGVVTPVGGEPPCWSRGKVYPDVPCREDGLQSKTAVIKKLTASDQPLCAQPVALQGVVMAKVQDPVPGLAESHPVEIRSSLQLVQDTLKSPPTFQQINIPPQLGVICKFTNGTLDAFNQIINKDVKQDWAQH
ncbi:hypothetical protein BTVI_36392 [Pitangus sulphuratus]|nr:hypothetical protein BTVI_36392 [Pitangus sulphuratus]